MRQYSIDRQNYHIFKTESGEKNPYVHFQWGKFDFRMTFKAGSKETVRKNPKKVLSAENGKSAKRGFESRVAEPEPDFFFQAVLLN